MVNGTKYQLEYIISGNCTDEDISRIGRGLAEGAELSVTDDQAVEKVTLTKLSAEVTKTVDLMEDEESDLTV